MKPHHLAGVFVALIAASGTATSAELPGHYFQLMEAELASLQANDDKPNAGAMLAAAVAFARQHAANPSQGDKAKLNLALELGDRLAAQAAADTAENKQDYEWEIHFWLDTFRLLEDHLGDERRARWQREIEKIVRWFAGRDGISHRLSPLPGAVHPHLHQPLRPLRLDRLPGRAACWRTRSGRQLGGRAMHRLAAEEQTPDGYWGEFTDNGPATGYNYLTMCCVALYWEHSRDAAALAALRRATDFHKHFTWPDGTPVETINGRNRHWGVSPWGQFGFSHWPDGRRYAEFLAGFFQPGKICSRDLGRLAQSALYYHEGPTEPIPQELPRSAYQMKVPAGIRKTGPWVVCLSGLIDAPIDSQFTLDRQGHLSIFHERLGLIITGADSKHQPELATFLEKTKDGVATIPLSSRLRMERRPRPAGAGLPHILCRSRGPDAQRGPARRCGFAHHRDRPRTAGRTRSSTCSCASRRAKCWKRPTPRSTLDDKRNRTRARADRRLDPPSRLDAPRRSGRPAHLAGVSLQSLSQCPRDRHAPRRRRPDDARDRRASIARTASGYNQLASRRDWHGAGN